MNLASDARQTMRTIRHDWRFALAFIVPLALGLGAGATFWSIIDHVLFRPPPQVADPGTLLRFAIRSDRVPDPFAAGNTSTSWLDYEALARHATTLTDVAAFISFRPSLGRGAEARAVPAMLTTASYFSVLGVHPQLGRFFGADEDRVASSFVPCVVGDRFWRVELGGTREALGRTLQVGNVRCHVIGVTPPDFNGIGISPNDLWLPVRATAELTHGDAALWSTDRSAWLRLIGRARPDAMLAQVEQDITQAYRTVTTRTRDPELERTMVARAAFDPAVGLTSPRVKTAVWLVGGAAALFLLVTANLVNLLVARNLGRRRETAIRLALGAGRARLLTSALSECALLALMAGVGALLVVRWVGPVARTVLYPGTAWADGPLNGRVVAMAIGLGLITGTAIALIAAVHASRVDPATLLAAGGSSRATVSRSGNRARFALVGVQAALSMALLVASAGFVRSFSHAAGTPLGFDIEHVIFADVPNVPSIDTTVGGRRRLWDDVRERVRALPGVRAVSLGDNAPWYSNRTVTLRIPGRDSLPLVERFGEPVLDVVTPEHLEVMQLILRAGRWIAERDAAGAPPVMVVSLSMATLYWGSVPAAIGECVFVDELPACREVIGVVDDIRFTGSLDERHVPTYYLPIAQAEELSSRAKMFVRANGDPQALLPMVRRIVQGAHPDVPAANVNLLRDHLDPLLASWRLGAMSFTALGILAALIAMLGLFSVVAYLVAERRKEFAIRSALGARRAQIVAPVVRHAVIVVGTGAVAGLLVAWRAAPWLEPQLFEVGLLDPVVVLGVAIGLVMVAVIAVLGPARRAGMVEAGSVLREQ